MPRFYRESEKKLARQQKRLSKKIGAQKGERKSSGWKKQQKKVAKIYKKIANQRQDYLQKQSKALAASYDIIAVEDINMKSLANKGFGRSSGDSKNQRHSGWRISRKQNKCK